MPHSRGIFVCRPEMLCNRWLHGAEKDVNRGIDEQFETLKEGSTCSSRPAEREVQPSVVWKSGSERGRKLGGQEGQQVRKVYALCAPLIIAFAGVVSPRTFEN